MFDAGIVISFVVWTVKSCSRASDLDISIDVLEHSEALELRVFIRMIASRFDILLWLHHYIPEQVLRSMLCMTDD